MITCFSHCMLVEVMLIMRKSCPHLRDKLRKLRLRYSGFHTQIACISVPIREVFANKGQNTLLSITVVGVEEN